MSSNSAVPVSYTHLDVYKRQIERQKQFYVSVGIPVHYRELGVKEEDIPTLCSTVRRGPDGMAGNFMKLDTNDLIHIYELFK